ncbi:MAG: O-antigen ligase family protein [Deltaproteobacteria bacterium]|nr:O-antigen ligase family protein [Deltaproteobacteria bacterium]
MHLLDRQSSRMSTASSYIMTNWRYKSNALVPWCLRLAALLLPLSEGITQGALLGALFLSWLAGRLRIGDAKHASLPAYLVTIGLTGWVIMGSVATLINGISVRSSNLNKAILSVGILLGITLVTSIDLREYKRLLVCLIIGSAVTASLGLFQTLLGSFPLEHLLINPERGRMGQLYIPGTDYRAMTGTLRNRTKLSEGLILVIASLSAASLLVIQLRDKIKLRIAFVIVLTTLLFTFTKAATASVIFALMSLIIIKAKPQCRKFYFTTLGLVLIIFTIFAAISSHSLTTTDFLPATDMWTTRRFIWSHALAIIRDHPIIGVGLGAYSKVSPAYFADPNLNYAFTLNTHSQHLTALAETGIIGFCFWITMCLGIGMALQRVWRLPLSGAAQAARHVATFYLIAMAPMSLVHDILYHPVTALLVWACIGIILALATTNNRQIET